MKKILSLLALVMLSCMGAWAQIGSLVTSTIADPKPLKMYNVNDITVSKDLTIVGTSGANGAAAGRFIIIATSNANEYYLYETTTGKYVAKKSGASNSAVSTTEFVDSPTDLCIWTITASNTNFAWLISPKGTTTYMNYYGGKNSNNNGNTIGFYTTGNNDAGSRWLFTPSDGPVTRYVNIENQATTRGQWLYNDITKTNEGLYTYQNVDNSPAYSATANKFVFRLTDEYGTYRSIINGEGYGIVSDNKSYEFLIAQAHGDNGYSYLKTQFNNIQCLNASADHSKNSTRVLTFWQTSGTGVDENATDNHWKVNDVNLDGKTVYNVVINGVPANAHPYVTYDEQHAGNGGFFIASSAVEENQLTASALSGYKEPVINVAGTTITVTYEPDPYVVAFDRNTTYTGADLAWQRAIKSITIGGVTKNVAEFATDNNSNEYKAYRDLTETCVFKIAVGEALNAKITIGSTDNKSWSDAYIYVDADESEQFTIADPDELYASLTGAGAITNFNNTFANLQSVPATEGTYRLRIVLGAQEPAGNAAFTTNMNRIVDVTLKVVDVTGLQNRIDEIMNAIYADAVGYPDRNNGTNTSAIANLHDFQSASATIKPINAENYNEALAALDAVYPLTAINLPVPGKAYRMAFVGNNGAKKYIQTSGNAGNEASAAEFICGKDGEKFIFVLKDGSKFMNYQGANTSLASYNTEYNSFTIQPLATSTSTQLGTSTAADRFGYVYMTSAKRASGNNSAGCMLVNQSTGAYNNSTAPYFDGTLTSAITFEEVANDVYVKLTNPNEDGTSGLDGKYVGTFSAPYHVTLPAGVKAYTAAISGTTVNFTELGTAVPANTGVLLYAESADADIYENAVPVGTATAAGTNDFEAMIDGIVNAGDYVLGKGTNGVGFYARQTPTTAKNKAYIPASAGSSLSGFRFDFEDTLTSIKAIEGNTNVTIFDLQGRRVQNAKDGFYIINGKKVIR